MGSLLMAALLASAIAREELVLRSPEGGLALSVEVGDPAHEPVWALAFRGVPLLAGCRLGLVTEARGDLLAGARLEAARTGEHDAELAVPFSKSATTRDRYRELRLALRGAAGVPVDVVFRCYDDALALRYEVGAADDLAELRLAREATSFTPVGEWTAYAQLLEHHRTSHEHEIERFSASALPAARLLDLPLTFERPGGPCFALTEAALRGYAGLSLARDATTGALVAALSPREDGLAVVRALPCVTPWRVVLVGDRPGDLLESQVIACLNDPPSFDASWVRPGKLTWPWWNGYLFDASPGAPILSLETSRRHIDFCAEHGIAYHAYIADEADSPWYHQGKPGLFPGPETDATRVRDGLPLDEVRAYAQTRGVGLWTWVHSGAVRGRTEAVCAALARHGFAGVMVDFLDRDDQETVEFAEEVLAAAARHHVLVHFHGMPKPTGLSRTYPNLMNHEGALNEEYLKWSDRCTPEHTLRVVFTRLLAGPLDYHLGGFRAVPRGRFEAHHVAPNVLGTRAFQLALYVCLDNPAPMVADYPGAYLGEPGFDFLCEVPTWWDETRVLAGEIGRLLVTARRSGDTWYLGGIAAGPGRALRVPLGFLPDGRYALTVWSDAQRADPVAGDTEGLDPNQLDVREREVRAADRLEVTTAADGGFVARLRRLGSR